MLKSPNKTDFQFFLQQSITDAVIDSPEIGLRFQKIVPLFPQEESGFKLQYILTHRKGSLGHPRPVGVDHFCILCEVLRYRKEDEEQESEKRYTHRLWFDPKIGDFIIYLIVVFGLFARLSVLLNTIENAAMTFLKTILILLLVYFGLKFLFRWVGPYIMRYLLKKAGQRFEKSFGYASGGNHTAKDKEGSVSIDTMPPQAKPSNSKVGEYVDYEEID